MKRVLIFTLLVIMALSFASCRSKNTSSFVPTTGAATQDEPTTAHIKKVVATAPPAGAETTAGATTEAPTTAAQTTVPNSTGPTTNGNIPADNITAAQINPNIGSIQSNVISEMNNLEMTELGLENGSVTLKKGESMGIAVIIKPTNASNKRLSVSVSNSGVKATVSGSTLKITAEQPGEYSVKLTSENDLSVSMTVTVVEEQTQAPTEAPSETEPAPAEEPSEE